MLTEGPPLGRFIYERSWTPVWGCYLNPLRFFGVAPRSLDPNSYLEVVTVLEVGNTDVAVTRGGGLFVRTDGVERTPQIVDYVVRLFNRVLCELAIRGVPSHPATDTDIQDGRLIDGFIAIAGGGGSHGEMTWAPLSLLACLPGDMGEGYGQRNEWRPVNFYWTELDPALLQDIAPLTNSNKLRAVNEQPPGTLVGAIFHTSRHSLSETIVSSWLVCESLISAKWKTHVDQYADAQRRSRLRDSRTYTSAVQIEVLETAGLISESLATSLHAGRRIRNDLAHNVKLSMEGAAICHLAMRGILDDFGVDTERLPGFYFLGGGGGQPEQLAEPNIPLRILAAPD